MFETGWNNHRFKSIDSSEQTVQLWLLKTANLYFWFEKWMCLYCTIDLGLYKYN